MAVKNPTTWTPSSGTGYVVTIGNEDITTNSGLFLTDNSGNLLVTNTTYNIPKYPVAWTKSTKSQTSWLAASGTGYVTVVAQNNVVDQHTNFIVDQHGNFIVSGIQAVIPKYATQWAASGA